MPKGEYQSNGPGVLDVPFQKSRWLRTTPYAVGPLNASMPTEDATRVVRVECFDFDSGILVRSM